jgi:hypothetical protein
MVGLYYTVRYSWGEVQIITRPMMIRLLQSHEHGDHGISVTKAAAVPYVGTVSSG